MPEIFGLSRPQAEAIQYGLDAIAGAESLRAGENAARIDQIDDIARGGAHRGAVPVIERNFQLVELSSGTANGDGTYNGWWILSAGGTFTRQQTIRIKQASGVTLTTGLYYFGYFSHQDETNHVGVFIVPDSTGGGGSVSFARDADAPTEIAGPISGSTIKTFEYSGITVGNDGTHDGLMLRAASETQQGAVDLVTQVLGNGRKAVHGNSFCVTGAGSSITTSDINAQDVPGWELDTYFGYLTFNTVKPSAFAIYPASGWANSFFHLAVSQNDAYPTFYATNTNGAGGCGFYFRHGGIGSSYRFTITGDDIDGPSPSEPCYEVEQSGGAIHTGIWGDFTVGANTIKVRGGIVVEIS